MIPDEPAASRAGSKKFAQVLAHRIHREIIAVGWPIGRSLGSELELLERYHTGRGVFREAVRLLESWQVAAMRAGRHGGLFVLEPSDVAVTHAASVYLDYARLSQSQLLTARLALEPACIQLAIGRVTESDFARLRATLEVEREAYAIGSHEETHNLHVVLADMSGNPALALFVRVLTRLTFERTELREVTDPTAGQQARNAHAEIVEAALAGEVGLAQHRMRRHLQALLDYIESRPQQSAS